VIGPEAKRSGGQEDKDGVPTMRKIREAQPDELEIRELKTGD